MITFGGVSDAVVQLNEYFGPNQAAIPEGVREMIRPLLGQTRSAVDAVVKVSEIVFANKEDPALPPELLSLAAASAVVAEAFGFHGMDEGSRGSKLSLALRRQSGEAAPAGVSWPPPEEDPEVRSEYVVPPPPEGGA